jgi:hypothetical protein
MRALGEAATVAAPTSGAWARGCGSSPMTLPRGSYEELVTTHYFIGAAHMRLVEQIRALHDYRGARVYAQILLRILCVFPISSTLVGAMPFLTLKS